ncbi:MAG TPA: Crp/Fnr family transcriptional regulator [Sphingomicrobium sp.]
MTINDPEALSPLLRRWEKRIHLSAADRKAIANLPWTRRSFARNAYLVREGEPPSECGLLLSGMTCRQKVTIRGARQILSFHIPGDFVDLQNCLLGEADHNVQAVNRSEVAIIPTDVLAELTSSHPAIGRAMWLDTLIDSSVLREWVVNLGRRNARSRISHLLCELSLRLQASGLTEQRTCVFQFNQQDIADATGLTDVHTNRTLHALRRDGLISLSFRSVKVLDWQGLKDEGEFSERYLHHAA